MFQFTGVAYVFIGVVSSKALLFSKEADDQRVFDVDLSCDAVLQTDLCSILR